MEHQTKRSDSNSNSKFANLVRQCTLPVRRTMFGLKLRDRSKTTQVHAVNLLDSGAGADALTIGSILSNPDDTNSVSVPEIPLPYGLPTTHLLEPPIEPHLKSVDLVESLADLHRRLQCCPESDKSSVCIEQYSLLCSVGDPKLLRRCLQAARQHAVDAHSKVVLSAWLRYERREDELVGVSSLDCSGRILECPNSSLAHGYSPNSSFDHCKCHKSPSEMSNNGVPIWGESSVSAEDNDFCICVGNDEVNCNRDRIATLSTPLQAMLYGNFMESKRDRIDFSRIGISAKGLKAVEVYSRCRRLDSFSPSVVLELLSFANRFCCEEMKSVCDAYLASSVCNLEVALVLIDYGLEETANLLVAACLQVFLRELPNSLCNMNVMRVFLSREARERLTMVGNASFALYYFLSQVAMEENMASNTTFMLLERLIECATEMWQKAIAFHQLGCVLLERKEYKNSLFWFEAASEAGHVYSIAGIARAKYKQGDMVSAYKLINCLISDHKPAGWMYQERSLYNVAEKRILDSNTATEMDPTLSFPYEFRSVAMVDENQIEAAILEIDRIIAFKVYPKCLHLRAWFYIALEDYEAALRDIRALLALDPSFMMFQGKMRGNHLIELLSQRVKQWSPADCWIQLYDRWSSVDDIGSLAVINHMLVNEPRKSLLMFRQSLLLLRLNCQKAAMRSLRLARNHATSEAERLVYEGWILYDTGHREEALSKAEESISAQRSFEAFFLKAYALADTTLDQKSSSYVIQLLEEALKCPSDGLRKGQALNNLGSIYVDCGKLDLAADCYVSALDIKHTRAHQGLARVYHLKSQRTAAHDEMTKLIEKALNKASAYEKRSEYCDRDMASDDLSMATKLDPLRTYPYRYRAAVLMDDQRETEAVQELSKAIAFKPELQMLHLRAAFHESMADYVSSLRDCEAALCLDPNHKDTLELYNRTRAQSTDL